MRNETEDEVAGLKEVDRPESAAEATRIWSALEARLRSGDASALAGLFSAHRDRLLHLVRASRNAS
ncbi:MAG TPA: hypothetical protein VNC50_08080, partial [Planctomycetia bacterium]|nr:hypothetical protein [Planctomycetia bacterium]